MPPAADRRARSNTGPGEVRRAGGVVHTHAALLAPSRGPKTAHGAPQRGHAVRQCRVSMAVAGGEPARLRTRKHAHLGGTPLGGLRPKGQPNVRHQNYGRIGPRGRATARLQLVVLTPNPEAGMVRWSGSILYVAGIQVVRVYTAMRSWWSGLVWIYTLRDLGSPSLVWIYIYSPTSSPVWSWI